MRNVLLAVSLVIAGLSARFGAIETAAPKAAAHGAEGAKASASAPAGGESKALPADHPITVLREYFRPTYQPTPAPRVGGEINARISDSGRVDWRGRLTVMEGTATGPCEDIPPLSKSDLAEYIVAMVPDPERTHLAQDLDRAIESIIAAAAGVKYEFDRSWLPWGRKPNAATAADSETALQQGGARLRRPGLLLFRREGKPPEVLVVFLVGEQPTAGIDRYQFHNALCYITGLSGGRLDVPWLILGPNFSGSFDSFRRAMGEVTESRRIAVPEKIQIVSPTSTSTGPRSLLIEVGKEKTVRPQFVMHTDEDVMNWALRRLRARNVAVLSEGDTFYGRGLAAWKPGKNLQEELGPLAVEHVSYPRDIAYLRNAAQELEAAAAQAEQGAAGRGFRQLPLNLKDFQEGGDAVVRFDATHLPVVQESVMLRLADRLKRRRIDTAVLTGTSTLDLMFLSKFLRQACPDVRLLLLDWHLLFVHGRDTKDFTDIVVAGTIPPFLHLEGDLPPPHVVLSQQSRGVYEAALALIRHEDVLPSDIWLSVIGRDDFWPVSHTNLGKLPSLPLVPRASQMFHVAVQVGFAVLAIPFLLAVRRKGPAPVWSADLAPVSPSRSAYLLLALALAAAAQLALASGPAAACWSAAGVTHAQFWTMLVLPAAAAVLLGVALADRVRLHGYGRGALGAAAVLIAAATLAVIHWGSADDEYMRAYRSAHISSGVGASWAPALLLLAVGWWFWTQAVGRVLSEDRSQLWPRVRKVVGAGLGPSLDRLADAAANWAEGWRTGPGRWALAGARTCVLLFVGSVAVTLVRSFESAAYDCLFSLLLALVCALLAGSLCEFVAGWRCMHRLLEALQLHPVRQDLRNLKEVSLWSQMWQGSIRRRSLALLERSAACLGKLTAGAMPPAIAERVEPIREYRATVNRLVRLAAKERCAGAAERGDRLRWEAEVDSVLIGWLGENVWASDSKAGTAPQAGERWRLDSARRLAGEYAALRIALFLRYLLLHLGNHFSVLTVTFILMVLATLAYPFQGESLFRGVVLTAFLAEAVVASYVFYQIRTDATLCELTDTKGGVDVSFLLRLAGAGALPLLAMLSSLFPTLRGFLLGWVQPALAALR